ncbi:hypothetical protein NEHOM01_0108 [Nematocida homosporus]|uniref:uncharacterized protein n=1 Tax=Nematocida homosporus TaxID=1912981 RepID=UPI00221ED9D7|nr:uncharacterized protein NEHOM01_0108 [Nematocida homosporus]KAI5184363.1 hypothetical protein NEHOM01_0108 [Nematocida homosporus]
MAPPEPFYMRFVRRSQEKKRAREMAIKDNISTGLKESIGYQILLRMGWNINTGLGRNQDGKVSLDTLIQQTKRKQATPPLVPELNYDLAELEYNQILRTRNRPTTP